MGKGSTILPDIGLFFLISFFVDDAGQSLKVGPCLWCVMRSVLSKPFLSFTVVVLVYSASLLVL